MFYKAFYYHHGSLYRGKVTKLYLITLELHIKKNFLKNTCSFMRHTDFCKDILIIAQHLKN